MLKLITIPDSLLESYDSHLEDDKIKSTRIFCILGVVLFMASSFVDIWAYPSILFEVNRIRSILMIAFGLIYWSTFSSFFIDYSDQIQHLMCLIPALGVIYAMSISAPTDSGHYIYFGFLILIIMVLFAWTHIPLKQLVLNATVMIVAYSVSIYVGTNIETSLFLYELLPSVFVMFGALCAGFVGRAINENHVRQNFLYSNSLKELAKTQSYYANHDCLTGLANRRYSEQLLNKDLNFAIKHKMSHSVMLFDLNGFKMINDVHGHKAGDEVLKVIAKRLQRCTREEDNICRLGGDEFVISLVVEPNNPEFVSNLQNKIKESVTQPIKLNNKMLRVGVSIGIASFPDDGSNCSVLLSIADDRMYHNKFTQRKSDELDQSMEIEAPAIETINVV